ncbi:MAG: RagB/SusD family nutrient uptake outer membrane protein [Tenacibaculum sp.]
MNNKYTQLIIGAFVLITLFSCEKDFLDRPSLDDITQNNFWKTPKDLELYTTQFYSSFPSWGSDSFSGGIYWTDANSDTEIAISPNNRLRGLNTISSGSGAYGFGSIRTVNIFFDNYTSVNATEEQINQWLGEAYFFRAYFYFNLLRNFGGVPYFTTELKPNSEELQAPRDSRNVTASNIIADLDQAINRLPSGKINSGNRLSKEVAMLFKTRVALYEGTWEKYHAGTPFGVTGSDGSSFLTIAAQTAEKLIDNPGPWGIDMGDDIELSYRKLFYSEDHSDSKEMMLWRKYDAGLGLYHNANLRFNGGTGGYGITKRLADRYLCTDGNPISVSPLYKGDKGLVNYTANRDPRITATIWSPGEIYREDRPEITFKLSRIDGPDEDITPTGYQIRKPASKNPEYHEVRSGEIAAPIFRFAEVLLSFAEAKAELATISQSDLDKSINVLRARAGMPNLDMGNIAVDPDWLYPSLSPIINEVRRERTVELAVEGYRFNDIARWAAADELIVGQRPLGAYFVQSDYPNLVIGTNIYVNEEGYLDPYKNIIPNGYEFNINRDYLLPIPIGQIVLNTQLEQNPGW